MGLWVITRELAAQRKIRLHIDVFYIATAGRKIRKKVLVNSRQELDLNIRQDSQLSETLYIDCYLCGYTPWRICGGQGRTHRDSSSCECQGLGQQVPLSTFYGPSFYFYLKIWSH